MLKTHYKILLLCLLIVFNSSCVNFKTYKRGYNKNAFAQNNITSYKKLTKYHRVKKGETLYSIAFQYGRNPVDVARWNNIPKPYTIFPKQKLRINSIASDKTKKKPVSQSQAAYWGAKKSSSSERKVKVSSKVKWAWPTTGKIASTFLLSDPGRRGVEISGTKGQAIKAAAAGSVVYSGNGLRGYGNLIILKHNDTFFSAYAHTEDVVVKEKEKVKLGQRLADMGNVGSKKPKLHFEIRRNGKPVNPLGYLPKRR